jgi:hypothetical protein
LRKFQSSLRGVLAATTAVLLLAFTPVASAQNWEVGKALHDANCIGCHPRKDGSNATAITTAIAVRPAMNYLGDAAPNPPNLSPQNIADIAGYLGHTSFPTATPNPVSYPFGEVEINATRMTTIQFKNNGDLALTATCSISGSGAGGYSCQCKAVDGENTCNSSTQCMAAAGKTCHVDVTFNPTEVKGYAAKLAVSSDGLYNGKSEVDLSGSGGNVPPSLKLFRGSVELSDLKLPFGTQAIGGLYDPITLTLLNAGTAESLEILLPAADSVPGFTFEPTPAATSCNTLPAFNKCELKIRFAPPPPNVQPYTANLILGSRAAGSAGAYTSAAIELSGTSAASEVPTVRWTRDTGLNPPSLPSQGFGAAPAGTSGATEIVRIFNAGPGSVVLRILNIIGADASNFAFDSAGCRPGLQIAEKDSCALTVRFHPITTGTKIAALQATAEGGTSAPMIVAPLLEVSGQGDLVAPEPRLELSVSSIDFGAQRVDSTTGNRVVRLKNSETNRAIFVRSIAGVGPFVVTGGTCSNAPLTLPPGAECTVELAFKPVSEGPVTGSMQITYDSRATALEVALSGEGEARPDLSSGGCSMVQGGSLFDPTLWILIVCAAVVLHLRRPMSGFLRRGRRQ